MHPLEGILDRCEAGDLRRLELVQSSEWEWGPGLKMALGRSVFGPQRSPLRGI